MPNGAGMSASVHGSARVVRGASVSLASAAGYPTVMWKDRAEMPCGCAVLAGVRLDNQEAAMVFTNCEAGTHFDLMARARTLYEETLAEPRYGVEAVEVAREVLCSAFNLEEHREQPL